MNSEDIIVWFFIVAMIVLVVVAVIFAVTRKKSRPEETGSGEPLKPLKPPEPPEGPDTGKGTSAGPVSEPPPGSSMTVIYSYTAEGAHRLCPFCDGEVSMSARICPICGQELQEKGAAIHVL